MTDYAARLLFMVYHSGVDVSVRYAGVEEKPIQRIGPVPCDKWILRLSCERRRGEIVIWTATKSGVAADLGAFLLDAFEYARLAERMRDWEDLAETRQYPMHDRYLAMGEHAYHVATLRTLREVVGDARFVQLSGIAEDQGRSQNRRAAAH